MYDSVLLFSGGVDSFVAYYYLQQIPELVYFNLNSKYSEKELNHLKKVETKINKKIIIDNDLCFLGQHETTEKAYIPYRNLFLATTTALKYSNKIYIAGLKDDNVFDKNEKIFDIWSETLSITNNCKVEILSPFWNMTKADVVDWYIKNAGNISDIDDYTLSCYSSGLENCNTCPACFRRNTVLFQNGIIKPFYNIDLLYDYKLKIGKGIYDLDRENYMTNYIKYILNEKSISI